MSAALNRYAARRRAALRAPATERREHPSRQQPSPSPASQGTPTRFRTGAIEQPDGSVLISPEQARVHRATEALAVFVLAPMQIWLGLQKTYDIPIWMRAASVTFGVGTILVDGGLLYKFSTAKKASS